jgi:glutathionylspermidine synthase
MKRIEVEQRDTWRERFDELGFSFHSMDGLYWNEGICYEFLNDEIDLLEEATGNLNTLCLEAVDYVIDRNLFSRIGIPEPFGVLIRKSWLRHDRSLYGRFDLSYDGQGAPKLLEYNADTPTSLVESSIAQWVWLEDLFPSYDQFNSIHEKLQDAFQGVRRQMQSTGPLYFSCVRDHEEDLVTVEYLRDVAIQSGLDGRHIFMEDIGYSETTGMFYDLEDHEIAFMFKLYPWEWIIEDEFGEKVLGDTLRFFEPPWKMVLSNKGILPVLWEMYPGHPNLLPSYFDPAHCGDSYVKKPFFSREGANITFFDGARCLEDTGGSYGDSAFIYQKAQPLPCFGGNYAVIGSWVVNGLPAGIGIREDDTYITKNTSTFVPHFFRP